MKKLVMLFSCCIFLSCIASKSTSTFTESIDFKVAFKKSKSIKIDSINNIKYLYFDFLFSKNNNDSIIYFDSKVLSNTKVLYIGKNFNKIKPSSNCLILENSKHDFRQFSVNYSKPTLVREHKCFVNCIEKIELNKNNPYLIYNYGINSSNLKFKEKELSFRFHYFFYDSNNILKKTTSNWIKFPPDGASMSRNR
jgi:hypothetical protein